MENRDIDNLLMQIKSIVTNKPITDDMLSKSDDLSDLQDAMLYLANCMNESNEFLRNLSVGNLDAQAPSRHNYMSAYLKELHSGLKHLTWQASRVANGDYKQNVSFLGDFSDSFNKMVVQLEDRENKLKRQADALSKSMNLLVAVMDGMRDWVLVTEKGSNKILYANHSSNEHFYNKKEKKFICGSEYCKLLEHLFTYNFEGEMQYDYDCPINGKSLRTNSFSIQWDDKMAFVHFITDITIEKSEKVQLANMAFKDELTGLYNRRYCIQKLRELSSGKNEFSVCLLDLDGLKHVNDTMGHIIGDEYITTVTNFMLELSCGKYLMCRVGGDEFLMVFPDCDEAFAKNKAIELDRLIADVHRNYNLSVSSGTFFVSSNMKLLPETILERADEKMYIVKCNKHNTRQ